MCSTVVGHTFVCNRSAPDLISFCAVVAGSSVLLAKRVPVRVLLRLTMAYSVVVSVSRGSTDATVTTAYKKVALKVHPDKGSVVADAQQL